MNTYWKFIEQDRGPGCLFRNQNKTGEWKLFRLHNLDLRLDFPWVLPFNPPSMIFAEENDATKPESATLSSDLNLTQRCRPLEYRSPGSLFPHKVANKRSLEDLPSLISRKSQEQASGVPILSQICMDIERTFNPIRVFGGVVICQTQFILLGYRRVGNSGLCIVPPLVTRWVAFLQTEIQGKIIFSQSILCT